MFHAREHKNNIWLFGIDVCDKFHKFLQECGSLKNKYYVHNKNNA